jgi:6-phosphofructokinase 1
MLRLPELPKFTSPSSRPKIRSFAVLTSGGDAPGMNAAIRAVVRYGIANGAEVYGVTRGYSGLLEGQIERLEAKSVANILQRGGTILKTDRCPAFHKRTARREAANILRRKGIEGLVVIGGDGSFTGAHLLEKENGFPCIGVPGTIDNDIPGTEDTIGFDTAVNTAIDAIDRIRDTASSHDRIFIVEVMGRSAGFISVQVGIGGGAETIISPEQKQSLESVCRTIDRGVARGKSSSIIVVAEGSKSGFSQRLATDLDKHGYRSRVCILGHTQRGGSPTAHDRLLASALGAASAAYLMSGVSKSMVGVQKNQVVLVPFSKVIGKTIEMKDDLLTLAQILAT